MASYVSFRQVSTGLGKGGCMVMGLDGVFGLRTDVYSFANGIYFNLEQKTSLAF